MQVSTPLALWQQLQPTAQALAAVAAGASATTALSRVPATLRAGVQALLFHSLRHWGRAVALRELLAPRKPAPAADALLCVALALCWQTENAPYEAFTLVDQAVEAAKRSQATRAQANFINACLRRFLRERDELVRRTDHLLPAQWNHPSWWIDRLRKDHPQHWSTILRNSAQAAGMTLRVNVQRTTRESLAAQWAAAGIQAHAVGEFGLQPVQALPVEQLPGFAQGLCSVQDAAAQMAAPLLLNAMGQCGPKSRILDACAAPGGKTAHLLELASAQVTALEVDAQRCERIDQNLQRLGLQAEVKVGDALKPDTWWSGQPWDGILLDAPCTASGIVRRHPDVPWLRRASDVDQLAALQQRMLRTLWLQLKPGGVLLYCTCSVFQAEGEHQIKAFLQHNTQAHRLPCVGHLIPQNMGNKESLKDNLPGDHDGFFYALLQKPLDVVP